MIHYKSIQSIILLADPEISIEHHRIQSEFERKEDFPMTIKKVTKKMAVTCKCKSSC
jgi:hypothetical protein